MPEVVYVIGAPGSGRVKIGRSINVRRRLGDIQRMCPVPLEVRLATPGGTRLETALHRYFDDCRVHGEWFDLGVDAVHKVTAAIAEIAVESQQPTTRRVEPTDEAAEGALEEVRLAKLKLDEALAERDEARIEAAKAVAEAVRGGIKPVEIIRLTGKSAETIRKWTRDHGVGPLRAPTSASFKSREPVAESADA